jgi:hypothetical protein
VVCGGPCTLRILGPLDSSGVEGNSKGSVGVDGGDSNAGTCCVAGATLEPNEDILFRVSHQSAFALCESLSSLPSWGAASRVVASRMPTTPLAMWHRMHSCVYYRVEPCACLAASCPARHPRWTATRGGACGMHSGSGGRSRGGDMAADVEKGAAVASIAERSHIAAGRSNAWTQHCSFTNFCARRPNLA